MTVMCLLLFVLPVSKKKIVDAGWVRVEFGQSGADGAPDFLGFGAFPWFSRFEVICKGGGSRPRDRILCKIWAANRCWTVLGELTSLDVGQDGPAWADSGGFWTFL